MILGVFLITAAPFAIGWLLFIVSRFREHERNATAFEHKLREETDRFRQQRAGFELQIEALKSDLRRSQEQNHAACKRERDELVQKANVCNERLFVAQEELRVLRAKDAKGEHLLRAIEALENRRAR